jgi:hypothetical protein
MPTKFKILAMVAALAAGTSSAAMAQYACAPGYTYVHGVCQPVRSPGYSNPASGAVSGEAAGAASGCASGGPPCAGRCDRHHYRHRECAVTRLLTAGLRRRVLLL